MPDFPLPNVAPLNIPPSRRIANLGPPPSARKGVSTYYPHNSFVAPIPEEIPEAHASLASGHVMPPGWGHRPLNPYQREGISTEDPNTRSPSTDGLGSRSEDHDESTQLVRPSGSGKRKRKKKTGPTTGLDRTSGTATAGDAIKRSPNDDRLRPTVLTAGARPSDATIKPDTKPPGDTSGRNDTTTVVPTAPGNSPFPSPTSPLPQAPHVPPHPGSLSSIDPRVNEILGNIEKGTAMNASGNVSPQTAGSIASERVARRPPPLNLGLAKEGERASQTSLPELIRRATRLAANLERTRASKAGWMDVWGSAKTSRTGSISDILAAFPSPSIATPSSIRWPPSSMTKSSTKAHGPPPPESVDESALHKSKARKCCGMPLWIFALALALVVLLVAAAVVIPITLIVLPRTRHGAPSLASCKEKARCGHGGSSVVADNSCGCVCANGFTGSNCANPRDQSCTWTDIKIGESRTVYQNATVGSGLPRLFFGAKSNFSIPLDSTTILSRFSATNLTCAEENVLVTFNGKAQRRNLPMQFVLPSVDLVETARPTPPPNPIPTAAPPRLARRDSDAASPPSDVVTSNGILFAATSTPVPAAAAPTPSSSSTCSHATGTPQPVPPPPAGEPLTSNGIPVRAVDFARVAVLLVFQHTSLDVAVGANQRLRDALQNPRTFNLTAVFATDAILVDFARYTVDLGNGTVIGANP